MPIASLVPLVLVALVIVVVPYAAAVMERKQRGGRRTPAMASEVALEG